ncbi:MAG: YfhO family protein [Planctomycetia bacterium]|nr:YfhO family protein [Planctomycetia bacterium]
MSIRGWPIGFLIVLGLLFFWPLVLQPLAVLYSPYSDFINYHVPVKHFLVRSWQQDGELPLWCPGQFAGMPFIHDPQVSAFYPPHAILYFVPPEHIGAACSWLTVFHVIVAGLCMCAYARHRGLETLPALLAALGYMLAGKWLLHLLLGGHFNVGPLAWLPLVLLFLERAVMRGSLTAASLAGGVFALIVLGVHPQMTLYAGLFVAAWSLLPLLEPVDDWRAALPHLRRWLGLGLWTAVVASLLTAVQLLPAVEASRESNRALGMPISLTPLFQGLQCLTGLVGPPLSHEDGWMWENRVGLGVLWLALAVSAPFVVPERRVRLQALFVLYWSFFGLGGMVFLQWVPGLNLFRGPHRLLLFLALPIALLTATTVQALLNAETTAEARARCRRVVARVVVPVLGLMLLSAWLLHQAGHHLHPSSYWFGLPFVLVLAWWLIGQPGGLAWQPWAWTGLLLADLALLAGPLVRVYPEAELYAPSECVRYLSAQADRHGRILDIDPIDLDNPQDKTPSCATPLWPNFGLIAGVESVRAYNPLDVLRFKEFLQFIQDKDEPLRFAEGLTSPGPAGFAMRNENLADLLGIQYLLMARDRPLAWFVSPGAVEGHWRKVHEDPAPRGYSFVPLAKEEGKIGVVDLPPYVVYERTGTLPRAFIVHEAVPLPDRSHVLDALKKTDFRRRVLLEDWNGQTASPVEPQTVPATARLTDYRPNQVTVEVESPAPGWLVLADVWFPGWTATVDGQPVQIHRANYVFRAVAIPEGSHRVVFEFVPRSYRIGQWISLLTLTLLAVSLLARWAWRKTTAR